MKEQKSEEEKLAELENQMLKSSVSTLRFNVLLEMLEKYHKDYIRIFQFGKRGKKSVVNDIIDIYIPNIVRDFPALINKIVMLEKYVLDIEKENRELKKQRDKAYKACGWKIYQFYDSAEHIDINSFEEGEYLKDRE